MLGFLFDFRVALVIYAICIFSVVFIERKKPSEVISWVMVVAFLPYVGFVLYLLIGETVSLRMIARYDKKRRIDYASQRALHGAPPIQLTKRKRARRRTMGSFAERRPVRTADAWEGAGSSLWADGSPASRAIAAGSGAVQTQAKRGAREGAADSVVAVAAGMPGASSAQGALACAGTGAGAAIKEYAFDSLDPSVYRHIDMVRMYERSGDSVLTTDNDITLFTVVEEKYQALLDDIAAAKKSIHMLYFAFNADHVGMRFIKLLSQKAREGVEVRVMYDMVGNLNTRAWRFNEIIRAGGQVRSFFSVINFLKVNYRNHRKIAVIDGQIAYTGGANISKTYIGEHKRAKPWRDTHIRLVGSCVNAFQERFILDWMHASGERFEFSDPDVIKTYFPNPLHVGGIALQVVSGGPDVEGERIKCGYIKMINDARRRLFVQSPYFVPDDAFMLALKLAVDSGVDVRIMLPTIPDKPYVYMVTRSYIDELLELGVKVYLHKGFIHSKMIVSDGEVASIGTANIDIRSFLLDFEINAFIYDCGFAGVCERAFLDDMKNSKEATSQEMAKRSVPARMLEAIMRIFAPLL